MTRSRSHRSAPPIKGDDLVAISFAATLVAPLLARLYGFDTALPFGLSPAGLVTLGAVSVACIYLSGLKSPADNTLRRLLWVLGGVAAAALVLGWLVETRADSYFTREALFQVSAVLLVLSIVACTMETHAARGTPADVLATGTSNTAAIFTAVHWLLTGFGLQIAGVIFMIMTASLMALTTMLRLPGAIVPIYRYSREGEWTRRRRRS